ncbi:MAG TPA: hypothetical protein VE988_30430 [Gemmataceae bacterium]|nr:hypothetical protein [Gemmataceae bacterium]
MSKKLLLVLAFGVVCVWVAEFGAAAQTSTQPRPAQTGDSQSTRLIYVVQHGSAKELAAALNKHFKGDAEFEPTSDFGSSVLLISAKPAVSKSVLETLAKLDRKRQLVEVDIVMLDLIAKQDAGGKTAFPEINEKDLSGTTESALASIKALQKKGIVSVHSNLQMTAVEGRATTFKAGGSYAYVAGTITTGAKDGKGRTSNTIMYRDVGTKVTVVSSVGPENVIGLDLQLDDSRAVASGPVLGTNEAGQPVLATEFTTLSYNSAVAVKSGHAILVKDMQTKANPGSGRSLIVVMARVIP